MVSVLIMTLNEEVSLPGCLDSIKWCDDVVVFDSFSTDSTVEIAESAGARVFRRRFDDYASQRNAALQEVDYKYPWVLMVDADERVTPELYLELRSRLGPESEITMFKVRRKDMFMGRWLKGTSGYPVWYGRVVRPGLVWVEREINEEYHTHGKIGYLNEHLIHYPFNKGVAYWYERHNRYSSMEAEMLLAERRRPLTFSDLYRGDPSARRKFLKRLAYRLPGRPILVFLYLYFVRMGFLDGRPGLTYCVMRMFYEHMIDVKVLELRR